jgi:hypothetical protein
MHDTETIPPFGPTIHVDTLGSAERKRTGHVFKDCPLRDLEPVKKGAKVVACESCRTRWTAHTAEAAIAQRAFDAAWYAQAAVAAGYENPLPPAPAPVATGDYPGRRTEPRVDRFEAEEAPPARREHRPNKYGAKCCHCGGWVPEGEGAISKASGVWKTAHLDACPEPAAKVAAAERATEPGAYVRLSDGAMLRVAVSRTSGNPYALLSSLSEHEDDEYLGGGRHLEGLRRATREEAAAYGLQTVRCCVCGTRLENAESRAAGIGPICASKGF